MIYLLDTNVCIRYLNGRSLPVRERLKSTDVEDIVVCSVVKAELFYGAMKSNSPSRTLANQQRSRSVARRANRNSSKHKRKSTTPVGIGEKTKTRTAQDGKHRNIHILHNDCPDRTGSIVNIKVLVKYCKTLKP